MLRVMLVDDEYMILEGLKKIIKWQQLGLEVVQTFFTAEEALAYLKDHTVDIILSDILFAGGMTGLDFLETVKKDYPYIAFILLSGHREFDYAKRAVAAGASDYLVKPVDKKELEKTLIRTKEEHVQLLEKEQQRKSDLFYTWLSGTMSDEDLFTYLFRKEKAKWLPVIWRTTGTVVLPVSADYVAIPTKNQTIFLMCRATEWAKVRQLLRSYEKKPQAIVGEVFEDGKGLKTSFDALELALDTYLFYHKEDVQPLSSFEQDTPTTEIETLVAQMTNIKSSQELHEALTTAYELYVTYLVHPDLVKHYTLRLELALEEKNAKEGGHVSEKRYWQIHQLNKIEDVATYFQILEKNYQFILSVQSYSLLTQQTLKLLNERYQENLLLKDIAETLHVNPMYLGQVLKKETGHTFSELINGVRIEKSKVLLCETDQSIQEVALAVGYEPPYYYRVFKRFTEMSPKEFREAYLNHK